MKNLNLFALLTFESVRAKKIEIFLKIVTVEAILPLKCFKILRANFNFKLMNLNFKRLLKSRSKIA